MRDFISSARQKVEQDTGFALLTQTRAVSYDVVNTTRVLVLPAQARPVQTVTAITQVAADGTETVVDPAQYRVDQAGGRIWFAPGYYGGAAFPYWGYAFQSWRVDVVVGWLDPADLKARQPLLVQAVGLLVAHYATTGRDLAITGTIVTKNLQSYEDMIQPFRVETIA